MVAQAGYVEQKDQDEMAVSEALGTARRFAWRLEYTVLIGVALLLTLFAIAFFYFSTDISNLKSYGYFGIFLINMIGAASIFLPSPAAASVVGGAAFLEPLLGIPAWFWVGLVAGLGEAIGEFSGYAAGYGGRIMVEDKPSYLRIKDWMEKKGVLTLFFLSCIPNPFFDVAGLAAGAVQMPMRTFFFAVLPGKIIKNWWLAGLAAAIVSIATGAA
ncbi:MAG: VTT domain-containing protein [Dehalococcoidia bacterium]